MHFPRTSVLFLAVVLLGADVRIAATQDLARPAPGEAVAEGPAIVIDGPPAPVFPAVVNHDERGRATIRAHRITTPLTIDGRLNEEVYSLIPGAGDWVQHLPREGTPPTEQTETWIFYDETNLYLAFRCLETDSSRRVATELRRDHSNILRNDNISIIIDTFYDRRNGYSFQTSPLGIVRDQQGVDNVLNEAWNTVWNVKSYSDDVGWYAEFVIPFKSLRYAGAGPQVWGFNARRIIPWKNEVVTFSQVPAAYGIGGGNRFNVAGTVVGIETPQASKNLELKPYVIGAVNTDKTAAVPVDNAFAKNGGFDFKYGLTRGLIFDATVKTDFAQVEEDLQQVNLTRFNLFFPERREFFLEGQGIFAFGGASVDGRNSDTQTRDVPILFFSRQIGLNRGSAVPVIAGGRLTGRVGSYSVGVLNIQTDDKPDVNAAQTNFTTIRLKRNILRRSYLGVLATGRAPSGEAQTTAVGLDANFQFYENIGIIGYYAKTTASGSSRADGASYRGRFDYTADRYGFEAERTSVGEAFNPSVGFVRRTDFRRSYMQARFSPRMRGGSRVRRWIWEAGVDYVENAAGTRLMNRDDYVNFGIEFDNADVYRNEITKSFEFIPFDFEISPGVTVPVGGYSYNNVRTSYNLGAQHKVQGTVAVERGSFYGGTRTQTSYSGYAGFSAHLAVEPSLNLAWVDLPGGSFVARVLTMRTIVTPTPRMMITNLVQYNATAQSMTSSVRLRWEYTPGSEFFVVYADGRNTLGTGIPELVSRSLAVKFTRLFRY